MTLVYDVSVVDLPGGGAGRRVADIRALDAAAAPSRIAKPLFGMRRLLGRAYGAVPRDGSPDGE